LPLWCSALLLYIFLISGHTRSAPVIFCLIWPLRCREAKMFFFLWILVKSKPNYLISKIKNVCRNNQNLCPTSYLHVATLWISAGMSTWGHFLTLIIFNVRQNISSFWSLFRWKMKGWCEVLRVFNGID
jgi:hypothetical protein